METHEKTVHLDHLQAGFAETKERNSAWGLKSHLPGSFVATNIHPVILLAYGGVADGLVNHFDASF